MRPILTIVTFLCLTTLAAIPVSATKICLKVVIDRQGRPSVIKRSVASSRECPTGYTLLVDSANFTGPQGDDGKMRIYGDGSAGAKVVASDETLADTNLNYTDLTVNLGATLTVPSGTVLRLTGTLTNNGTIAIVKGAEGGFRDSHSTSVAPAISHPHQGAATRGAGVSEIGDATSIRLGGAAGIGLTLFEASQIRFPGTNAGGAGGCADPHGHGSDGGGSLVVLAKGPIVNNSSITALGEGPVASILAGGGGAGGIIVLASLTSVTNGAAGEIHADGGDGAEADSNQAPSGGGGGGIIHFVAPQVSNLGVATASAGGGGALVAAGYVSDSLRGGGGGGGACGGNGGSGGSVSTNGQAGAGQPGDDGYVILTTADPTYLF